MDDLDKAILGLSVAWILNDTEELLTYAGSPTQGFLAERLRGAQVSQQYVNTAIGITGTLIAAITTTGLATRGRSPVFRGGLLAFGLHGFLHLGLSARARGYTSGLLTAPTVIIPYWLWARRVLRAHGLSDCDRSAILAAVVQLALMPAVHRATYAILGAEASVAPADLRTRG